MDLVASNLVLIGIGITSLIVFIFIVGSRSAQRKEKSFHLNKKRTVLVFLILFSVYATFAIIETYSLSFSSVDEAFNAFLDGDTIEQDDITDQSIHFQDDYAIVLFRSGSRFAFTLFEEGFFGWRFSSASIGGKDNTYTSTDHMMKGWIPDEYESDTNSVLVNGHQATIIEMDQHHRAWIFIDHDREIQDESIIVSYADSEGNDVHTMDD